MKVKSIGFVLVLVWLCLAESGNVVVINQERGKYELDFNATYQTYIHQDIETAIILPVGYKFVACMPGSRDYVSAGPLQNTMYISCPVDHDVVTNLTLHVITPEGAEEKLIFKLYGKKASPNVLAIEFERPNNSELNRTVEAVKARYSDQMNAKISEQEKNLNKSVHNETIENARHFWIDPRGDIRQEYKGAQFYLDGMINSRGNTYVYIVSKNYKDGCDIIRLISASDKKGKKDKSIPVEPELLKVNDNGDGTFTYVYSMPEIAIPPLHKTKKIYLTVAIWSKNFTLKFKVS
jgi:hypothetical protein